MDAHPQSGSSPDSAPTPPALGWEPTVWRRRMVAFCLDLGAIATISDLIRNNVAAPSAALWLPWLEGVIAFGYRFLVESLYRGSSLGKGLAGIGVARDTGGPPTTRETLARSMFLALLLGPDYGEALRQLFSGFSLGAVSMLPGAACMGYAVACLWPALRSRQGRLPHDRWSGTRIVRADTQAQPNPWGADEPMLVQHPRRWMVAMALAVTVSTAALSSGTFVERVLGRPRAADATAKLERDIARITGVRNTVSATRGVRIATGRPRVRLFEVTAEVPWCAADDAHANAVLRVLMDSTGADPRLVDEYQLRVLAKWEGLLPSQKSIHVTTHWDPEGRTWRIVDEPKD